VVKLVWFGKVHSTDFLLVNGDVRDLCLFALFVVWTLMKSES
jgi:uncharacterized membrane protein